MSGERVASGVSGNESIAFPSTAKPSAPRTIGRYEIVDVLGQGGMASVYLARTRGPAGFQKLFAIKKVHEHLASDRQFAAMFLDEARIAAALHHPNVAQVFELGEDQGAYFLAMEYLLGEHLGMVLRKLGRAEGPAPIAVMARIVALAAEGLHHAHEAHDELGKPLQIVHRDVSPQNIFVTYAGHVKLTDFGIAKATTNEVRTDTGTVKGKFAYMSPEQALGRPIDRRTDVFALGAVLWEAVTLRRLFRSPTDAETLLKVTRCEVPVPSSVSPGIPAEIDRIVMRCLAAAPEGRYATAGELAQDLEGFLAPLEGSAHASAIGALMTGLFGDEIATRQAAVRRVLTRDVEPGPAAGPALVEPAGAGPEVDETISQSKSRPRVSVTPEPLTPPMPLLARAPASDPVEDAPLEETAAVELSSRRARASRVEPVPLPTSPVPGGARASLVAGAVVLLLSLVGAVAFWLGGDASTSSERTPGSPPLPPAPPEDRASPTDAASAQDAAIARGDDPPPVMAAEVTDAGTDGGRRRHAPREPASSAPFVVEVSCVPSAEVFVGSHSLGMTPVIAELPAGGRIRLRSERGERIVRPTPGPDGVAQVGGSQCP